MKKRFRFDVDIQLGPVELPWCNGADIEYLTDRCIRKLRKILKRNEIFDTFRDDPEPQDTDVGHLTG